MNNLPKTGPRILQIPPGDSRKRLVCPDCDFVHYENPKISVGSVPSYQGKVLLCRRAIEPKIGFWTIPSGYLELNETPQQGAKREAFEEANAQVEIGDLIGVYTIGNYGVIQMVFRSTLTVPEYSAGEESLEVDLFSEDEIPWSELSFHSVEKILKHYFSIQSSQGYHVDFHSYLDGPA